VRHVEVNAGGRVIRELKNYIGDPGHDVHLTIDTPLQFYVQDRLRQAESASAVVMNAHNGEILALGSYPAFDSNDFVLGFARDKWNNLINDERAPFRNKAVAGAYAPGSTFKLVVVLAALEHGIDPEWFVRCTGYVEVGPQRFHCWHREGHGRMNMRDSVKHSCDIYYYELAQELGIDRIAAMARRLGFGESHLPELYNESRGLIPSREWKEAERDDVWRIGDTLQASIGQGYVLATPVQIAIMMSRIVNGGWAVGARLVKKEDNQQRERLNIRQEHLDIVMEATFSVTNEKRGTAYKARIEDEKLTMAGKTGTSQVRRISEAERKKGVLKNEDLEWRLRDHALFVGYAPFHNPKYVCSVVVEHGGSGSATAAPIARDILTATQLIDPIGTAPAIMPKPKPSEMTSAMARKTTKKV
jgi:penicillin-binding protein 2